METWENKLESQDPIAKVTAMMEKPKIIEADQKRIEFLNMKVIDETAKEDTWKKISKIENALKKRVLAFKEKARRYAGNPKGLCEKLESHLTRHDWQTIPDKGIKNMLLGCITGQDKVLLQQTGEGIVFDMYRLPEF